ncbi:MAG: hypothetical protein EBR30_11985 [Cytophagia bacterium]|nr:hypothetical protein [Cytophagia bacterium]
MSTLDQVVTKTKNKLTGSVGRDKINTLNDNYNSSVTTIGVTYTIGNEISPGTVIEIDYEQLMVVSVASTSVGVIRGWNGTTAASHTVNTVVYIEPRFPRQAILDEVCNELRALPQTIYTTGTAVLTFVSNTNRVDLTGATGTIYRILHADRANFDGQSYPGYKPTLQIIRNADTTAFPSGYAVAIEGGLSYGETATVRIVYAKSLSTSTLTSSTDLQSTVGLPITAEDILQFGAASRLLYDKESLRLDFTRQGQSRAAEEIPPEVQGRQAQRWRLEADRRISEEAMRLAGIWGIPGA